MEDEYRYLHLFVSLTIILLVVLLISERRKLKSSKFQNASFYNLQVKYLTVFGLATFADWLQGAYLYKIYSFYKFNDSEIAIIYIFGFISSGLFGWIIGNIADHFGRKKICILYNIFYILSCYFHSYNQFEMLVLARVFGGLSSCILFSSFESWYIFEHCSRNNFPKVYLKDTFAKSTFINGSTAVLAGLIGNFMIDSLKFNYIVVFYFAIFILVLNMFLTAIWWSETNIQSLEVSKKDTIFNTEALKFIVLSRNNKKLLLVGCLQLLFETTMYNFIFLWTPVLNVLDKNTPVGLVFSLFMISIMIGSTAYSIFSLSNLNVVTILIISCVVAFYSFCLGIFFSHQMLLFFIFYEFSVGLYFPCMSYIRSVLVPEHIRNSVANWYRLPICIFTIFHLLLIKNEKIEFQTMFFILSLMMLLAIILSIQLRKEGLSRAILPAPINS